MTNAISLQGVDSVFPTARGDYALTVYDGYYAFLNTVDKQAAAKLLDFCFSEEYWRWNRDGLEGNDFEIDANGNIKGLNSDKMADEIIVETNGGGRFYMGRAVLPCLDIAAPTPPSTVKRSVPSSLLTSCWKAPTLPTFCPRKTRMIPPAATQTAWLPTGRRWNKPRLPCSRPT